MFPVNMLGMSNEQNTFESLVPQISFFKQASHVVEFDPTVELITVRGTRENGETWTRNAIPVKEDGVKLLLPLSKELTIKLKKIGRKSTLKITRAGSGFDTTYDVQVMTIQQKVTK